MKIETKILDERLFAPDRMPDFATAEAAAIDLRACTVDGMLFTSFLLAPGARAKIGTGIAVDLGSHGEDFSAENLALAGMILPRSGLGSRGITIGNAPGLIDGDYQGEIFLAMWNSGNDELVIKPMDRLAQFIVVPVLRPYFTLVSQFSRSTERGAGGFCSTGTA